MDQASTRRRTLKIVAVIAGISFAWHLLLTTQLSSRARSLPKGLASEFSLSVNPLTNLVTLTIALPPGLDDSNPFVALGSVLGEGLIEAMGPAVMERDLNTYARERLDLYALIVPYRARIATKPASPQVVARMREEREKRRAEEAQAKTAADGERLEAIRAYVSSNLLLESVRVDARSSFGVTTDRVFGTIVNNGPKTLRKVTVRFYFLDGAGRRIGEKDFSPVWVTELFPIGDNTPLRPGYRKDFAYNADAPSGWSRRVEAEIVDVEFM
ncbi:MAG: hypothetical protein HYY46_22720 [Deltaproteobacteria bacterium]|nr:hypothetical protein [Deltaproteobacteria bacterium]